MHMADALISPGVGGVMWGAGGAAIVYCSRKTDKDMDDFKVPLMGVMGAFVFAAQMINFTIPGTGSSGHIVGALLLSVLLGPYAGLLVISSILVVQALFFADGGLLALGCNIFNMGVIPCLLAYPLIYKPLTAGRRGNGKIWFASVASSVAALTLGASCVVLETCFSGISALPFSRFLLLMLPIHIAIGTIEGIATAAVLILLKESEPSLFGRFEGGETAPVFGTRFKRTIIGIALTALFMGSVLAWFASEKPDGLEWSISKIMGGEELSDTAGGVKSIAGRVQKASSLFPDYRVGVVGDSDAAPPVEWGGADASASVAGMAGVLITLSLAFSLGLFFRKRKNPNVSGRS